MSKYIAVDVGGTHIRVAVYSAHGITSDQTTRIATQQPEETALERLQNQISEIWPVNEHVAAIGIAAPGPVDQKHGIIFEAPNIPGWVNLPLRSILEERFGVPVSLGNDANLAALGEWKYGAGQGHHHVLYLTISTGIGGGAICDDRLILGAHGLANELGHVTIDPDGPICSCGRPGHLEALSSGTAIARYVANQLASGAHSIMTLSTPPTAYQISQAAQAGDALAQAALDRAGRYLGIGLANFVEVYNPSIVILGGGVSQSGSYLWDAMKTAMQKAVMSPEYLHNLIITPAALGDDAGLLGALALGRTNQATESMA
ncbi:MAG: ROK family protein [Anaerolineaceae bacterium]|nr:ROK family protein [Anaerolineaceae bacterium]